ncbi:putative metalloprotease CJM1_0395 family protein [Undibacterium flavidum]|uniref:SprA family protein n=1 Tax=Undibacterium flavidum TaxID=2762297 RepID=A0ABR6Y9X9_9BURK|nr:putative metalloprotease CJM1_0395 family protein [Undibacterium flavidum]MBC3872979.1 hypothetical protein [Undibacterium flavidum]
MGISGISSASTFSITAIGGGATIDANNRRQLLASAQLDTGAVQNVSQESKETSSSVSDAATSESASTTKKSTQLSAAEAAQVAKLQARDRQVRLHEMAHLAASGGLATSGASFTYQKGPDGVDYAVGGEVSIDTSPGRTPEDTIARARQIQAAALAPADPSGQDRAVAAMAQQMEIEANGQLMLEASAKLVDKSVDKSMTAEDAPRSPSAEKASKVENAATNSDDINKLQRSIDQVQQAYSTNSIAPTINVYA